MSQIFRRSANSISRVSIFGAVILLTAGLLCVGLLNRSPYLTQAGIIREQPVPFSHEHHVGGLGIDCRYCHTSVETSSFAGLPPTSTCMTCHSQIWTDSPMLKPVRESFRTGQSIEWTRVHDLPDFVYFDHSIHVAKGVACATCHGNVATMPLMARVAPLNMEWCLDCHRNPKAAVGPKNAVFKPEGNLQDRRSPELEDWIQHHVESKTNCSVCHR